MIRINTRLSADGAGLADGDARSKLSAFGDDIIGLWQPFIGSKMKGVSDPGDTIGTIAPVIGKQTPSGAVEHLTGGGSTYELLVDGDRKRPAMSAVPTSPYYGKLPESTSSFGVGAIMHISELTRTLRFLGSLSAVGINVPIGLSWSFGSAADKHFLFGGLSSTWFANTATPDEKARLYEPESNGFYIFSCDLHGGASGFALNHREPVVGPGMSVDPLWTEFRFGNWDENPAPEIHTLGAMICNGPLVQNAERLAQWRAHAQSVIDAW